MAQIIDGKAVSRAVRARVAQETLALKEQGVTPGLAVILVGEDPASQVYVRNKEKDCTECGILSQGYRLPVETEEGQLLELIDGFQGFHPIDPELVPPASLIREFIGGGIYDYS